MNIEKKDNKQLINLIKRAVFADFGNAIPGRVYYELIYIMPPGFTRINHVPGSMGHSCCNIRIIKQL